jgi:hypothetical protein
LIQRREVLPWAFWRRARRPQRTIYAVEEAAVEALSEPAKICTPAESLEILLREIEAAQEAHRARLKSINAREKIEKARQQPLLVRRVRELHDAGISFTEIAEMLGSSERRVVHAYYHSTKGDGGA